MIKFCCKLEHNRIVPLSLSLCLSTLYTWAGDNIIRGETNDKATDYFYGINLVSRTVTGDAYTYNVRQTSYDEDGNRVVTNIPVNGYNEFYAYDGRGNVVHTLNPDIDLYVSPFFGSTSPLPEADFDGDGLINVKDLSMMSSYYPIVRNYYYSPFGEIWQGEIECDTNPFRYAGEYLDKDTGDIYLRARYYNPSIGRFVSVDPIKDGTNWYVYCGNNPVMFVDPSGLDEEDLYQGSGSPENDAAILKQSAVLEIQRLISLYLLAEEYDNTLIMEAINYKISLIRQDGLNHKDDIDYALEQQYTWATYSDEYPYSNYQYKYNVSIDIVTFTSFSAWYENGGLIDDLSLLFSSLSQVDISVPIQFSDKISIDSSKLGEVGDFLFSLNGEISKYFGDSIYVSPGDSKITITVSGFLPKTTTFYFRDGETQYFSSENEDAWESQ